MTIVEKFEIGLGEVDLWVNKRENTDEAMPRYAFNIFCVAFIADKCHGNCP